MSERLRVAVAGSGYYSRFHYDAWSRLERAELVALATLDNESGEAMARDFSVPQVFDEVGAMLDQVKPDLLDIVTPPPSHHELVALAAARGVPVVCQKPLAPTLAEAEALVAEAEAAGLPLIVHENFRFMPWFREAARLVAAGQLGAPHSVHFRMRPGDGQGPEAYLNRQPYFQEMPRFLIHETGIHFIDVFRSLMGEVRAVTARLRRLNPAIAGEDSGVVIFEFDEGVLGVLDGNRLNDHSAEDCRLTMGEMHLEGAEGVLRLNGYGRLFWKPHGKPEVTHDYDWALRGFGGDCVYALQQHVLAHFLDDAPTVNSGRDYLTNIRIEEAIYESSETGRRVALD